MLHSSKCVHVCVCEKFVYDILYITLVDCMKMKMSVDSKILIQKKTEKKIWGKKM